MPRPETATPAGTLPPAGGSDMSGADRPIEAAGTAGTTGAAGTAGATRTTGAAGMEGAAGMKGAAGPSGEPFRPSRLTLTAGRDKSGRSEASDVTFVPGQVTALLGPTGSGKSRFLSDIESMANGDTPTGRTLLIDGRTPDPDERFALQGRLVAQLTQNMNFVLDMRVGEFVHTHAESRQAPDPAAATERVLAAANALAGEPFGPETQLTELSGGQSRALMIADTALLSWSPVLLIDEIENAGVDKRKALSLLVESDKIIVMATHDPILALSAHRRLVFAHGAATRLWERAEEERAVLAELMVMESEIGRVRERLRQGLPLGPGPGP